MRSLCHPLVLSNLSYGIAAIDAYYHDQNKLMKIECYTFIGSFLYHLFHEQKWMRPFDYIPGNIAMFEVFKAIYIKRHSYSALIYSILHFSIAVYSFIKGGWPCCNKKYDKWHTIWHIFGGAGFLSMNYSYRYY